MSISDHHKEQLTKAVDDVYLQNVEEYDKASTIARELQSILAKNVGPVKVDPAGLMGFRMALKGQEALHLLVSFSSGTGRHLNNLFLNKNFAEKCGLVFEPKTASDHSEFIFRGNFKSPSSSNEPAEPVCVVLMVSESIDPLTKSLLKLHCQRLPEMLPRLCVALQYWAKCLGFFEHNVLTPEAIALMTVHFLQHCDNEPLLPVLTNDRPKSSEHFSSKNQSSLGELWLELLQYFSEKFDYKSHLVNIISNRNMIAVRSNNSNSKYGEGLLVQTAQLKNLTSQLKGKMFQFFHEQLKLLHKRFSTEDEKLEFSAELMCLVEPSMPFPVEACHHCNPNSIQPAASSSRRDKGPRQADIQLNPALPPMTDSYLQHLNQAVSAVVEASTTNRQECESKTSQVVSDVANCLKQTYPNAVLHLYGSCRNGFQVWPCDVDLCLTFSDMPNGVEPRLAATFLHQISSTLQNSSKLFQKTIAITHCRVPVVKFQHRDTALEGDICLYNTLALWNTKLLRTYSALDDRCRMLGLMAKHVFKNANICDASMGFLSSYAYTLMVIFYLQQTSPPVLPCLQQLNLDGKPPAARIVDGWDTWFASEDVKAIQKSWPGFGENKESVASLWVGFLEFYTETFDAAQQIVSIRQVKPLMKFEKNLSSKLLTIEDPFELTHNLGHGIRRLNQEHIFRVFSKLRSHFGTPRKILPAGYPSWVEFLLERRHFVVSEDGPDGSRCFHCKRPGHISANCERRQADALQEIQSQLKVTFPQKVASVSGKTNAVVGQKNSPKKGSQVFHSAQQFRQFSHGFNPRPTANMVKWPQYRQQQLVNSAPPTARLLSSSSSTSYYQASSLPSTAGLAPRHDSGPMYYEDYQQQQQTVMMRASAAARLGDSSAIQKHFNQLSHKW